MNYKKVLLFLLCFYVFVGCKKKPVESELTTDKQTTPAATEGDNEIEDREVKLETFNVGVLRGPTGLGLVKLMEESSDIELEVPYSFHVKNAPDEIVPMIVKGDLDFAAVPANLASILYNNTEKEIAVIGINTLGVLHIIENGNSINSIADLKGKTIYSSGKGASPEFALNFILKSNGIDIENDVTIEFKSEHAEIVALMEQDENAVALLPEPFASTIMGKKPALRKALDLTAEWAKISPDTKMITGVVVARKEVIEKFPQVVDEFLDAYKKSVDFVNENVDETVKLAQEYGVFDIAIPTEAIPNSNITLITGEEMQKDLNFYLNVLFESNPESIGGNMPDEKFYYKFEIQ